MTTNPDLKKFTVNFTTKMGMTAKKSISFLEVSVKAAKDLAFEKMNGDTYTFTIIDKAEKTAWHYGYTGIFLGTNKI